ncbi:2-dehydropantoate 2-reductase [Halalkalibacter wakoensis JCM 9140]|uniref:2-dehydropantoate 2-reductase n=1 Tax=Halalkalibacter wakoensis JCM 9140 TaxID=1236970 RepID=W4PZL9_9BACI|nr:ketopantoate reductase family protein [Halalkalibacter wakoensis]GAE25135.1 2-dehydropantoate 2-reductase [Halalkalibacter wakoensis JCM 9140]
MNIVVVGAGAVGGYFGGKLAKSGEAVTFLVRQKRYEQLTQQGLQVNSIYGDFSVHPHVVTEAKDIQQPELVIVALKNYHLEAAMPELATLVENGAKILPLLNGVEHLDLLTSTFGQDRVLGGICYIESTLNNDNHIVHTSKLHHIVFGSILEGDENFLQKVLTSFEKAHIPSTLSKEIVVDMWKKYTFLTTLSGVTSVLRQPIGVALQDPVMIEFLKELIKEVVVVGMANKINLSQELVTETMTKLQDLPPEMTSSMHRDLEKGLRIELDSIQGYLLKNAKLHTIDTPCLRSIYAFLHPFKNGN